VLMNWISALRNREEGQTMAEYGVVLGVITVALVAVFTLLGVLTAVRRGPPFADEEVQLAEAFTAFAGVALDNAHRLELEHALVNELQESIERKRVLIGSVTHEFRTPLTCIEGFSETLLERWSTFTDDERRNLVAKVSTHAQDLDRLVSQLLDFAVTERGMQSTSVTQVPLRSAISSALATLEPLLGDRPIIMDVPDLDVLADPLLLRRALGNLFSNAVKYSPPETPITLRAEQDSDTVRVEVTDEGPGLSEDELEHAFEPFWRAADNRTRGAGLGLTLVAEYVRAMGGSTGVVSAPQRGSTFFFTLSTTSVRQAEAEA
jgi:signal transduction histidine kinase